MKHHPVVIITSNPDGMSRAVKHLEVEGYEVKVLDSLGANLIDFFSAISSTDPEVFSGIDDTPKSDGVDSEIPAETKDTDNTDAVDDPNMDVPSMDDPNTDLEPSDSTDPSAEVVFKGTVNDESIDIHEVPGDEIILHPKSISGSGDKEIFGATISLPCSIHSVKKFLKSGIKSNHSKSSFFVILTKLFMIKTPLTNGISNNAFTNSPPSWAFSALRKSALSFGSNILFATNFILSGFGVASA
jgi:hypothetical protein